MKYRKKPVVIEATRWYYNGDHPEDGPSDCEGKVVRYYRDPDDDGKRRCQHCDAVMHVHGWIDTLEGGHIVCPGDYVITGIEGEHYPCKARIFMDSYEPVED